MSPSRRAGPESDNYPVVDLCGDRFACRNFAAPASPSTLNPSVLANNTDNNDFFDEHAGEQDSAEDEAHEAREALAFKEALFSLRRASGGSYADSLHLLYDSPRQHLPSYAEATRRRAAPLATGLSASARDCAAKAHTVVISAREATYAHFSSLSQSGFGFGTR
ncbi:hypothetical protein T492DRAFT_898135 [Pavlovales sp. CCMP2436]|nr:hypothetical protein T492DRAFT_898135 [Pavlovales sp. CCMP2436]